MYEEELQIARLAVQRASLVTKNVRSQLELQDEVNKDDDTPVTIADLTAQALVIGAIYDAFPGDSFLGEESAQVLRENKGLADRVWSFVLIAEEIAGRLNGKLHTPATQDDMLDVIDLGKGSGGVKGRFWILDPIDGTITYMKGQQYAVCLALIENGKKVMAVQGCPNLSLESLPINEDSVSKDGGYIVSAVAGEGAYLQHLTAGDLEAPQRIPQKEAPSHISQLRNVESLASTSLDHEQVRTVCERHGIVFPNVDIWAQQMKYIAMAIGGHDLMIRIPAYPSHRTAAWDHASGQLICEEVGLKLTDVHGKEHDYSQGRRLHANFGDVVTYPKYHSIVLRTVQEVMATRGKE